MGREIPRLAKKLYAGWMAFARILGFVNTRIVLTVVYFVLFGPGRLVQLVMGRDFLDRKIDDRVSNWKRVEPKTRKVEDYHHLF